MAIVMTLNNGVQKGWPYFERPESGVTLAVAGRLWRMKKTMTAGSHTPDWRAVSVDCREQRSVLFYPPPTILVFF